MTENAAAAATPPEAPPPTTTSPAAKTYTQEQLGGILAKERAEYKAAQAAKFKEFGVESEDQLAELLKSGREAREAALSESQKQAERVTKLEKEAAKAKADAAAAVAEALTARQEATRARIVADARPTDVKAFEALYELDSKAENFDAKVWIEEQQAARPYLFAQTPAPAKKVTEPTTTTTTQSPTGDDGTLRRATERMSDQDYANMAKQFGLPVRR